MDENDKNGTSKVIAISARKEDIEHLSRSIYQFAESESRGYKGAHLESLIARINERKQKVGERDLLHISRELEALVLDEVTRTCGASSCTNCDTRFECSEYEGYNIYNEEAVSRCASYSPDREVFDKMAEKIPKILMSIKTCGVPVNIENTAKRALEIAGSWLNELVKAGKSLPPRL